jgi:hypothetical protein
VFCDTSKRRHSSGAVGSSPFGAGDSSGRGSAFGLGAAGAGRGVLHIPQTFGLFLRARVLVGVMLQRKTQTQIKLPAVIWRIVESADATLPEGRCGQACGGWV